MIETFYKELIAGLKKIRNVTIYDEGTNHDNKTPCFIISSYSETQINSINKCRKSTISVKVTYLPESNEEPEAECRKAASDMDMEMYIEGFKIRERNAHIEDGILQYSFKTTYKIYKENVEHEMKEYDVNIKEE